MRGKIAVRMPERRQALGQQREVIGLLGRHLQPVRIERSRQAREAPDRVEGKVDRIELDMGKRVQQHRAPFGRTHAASLELARLDERRARRPAGQIGRLGQFERRRDRRLPGPQRIVERAHPAAFATGSASRSAASAVRRTQADALPKEEDSMLINGDTLRAHRGSARTRRFTIGDCSAAQCACAGQTRRAILPAPIIEETRRLRDDLQAGRYGPDDPRKRIRRRYGGHHRQGRARGERERLVRRDDSRRQRDDHRRRWQQRPGRRGPAHGPRLSADDCRKRDDRARPCCTAARSARVRWSVSRQWS